MMLLIGIAYVSVGLREVITYDAEAVFFVPANVAGQQPPGDQDAAVKLAKTYAAALPLNQELMKSAADKSREPLDYVQSHLKMTNDTGTSMLRVQYAGTSPQATADLLTYISGRLTAYTPPKPVSAGSIKIVNLPDTAIAHGGDIVARIPLGLSLGIVAAVAITYVLETVRPRIDTVQECHDALAMPTIWWGAGAVEKIRALVRRSGGPGCRPYVELVPADRKTHEVASAIKRQIDSTNLELDPGSTWPLMRDRSVVDEELVILRPADADRELDDRRAASVVIVVRCGALRSGAHRAVEALTTQSHRPTAAVMSRGPQLRLLRGRR
jgi:capsular polysaccharide biosynthesis protein